MRGDRGVVGLSECDKWENQTKIEIGVVRHVCSEFLEFCTSVDCLHSLQYPSPAGAEWTID